jgi:hypothetical protein
MMSQSDVQRNPGAEDTAVLMPGYVNFSIAPDTLPVLRRSLTRAHKWAGGQVTPMKLDDYLQAPAGLPYKNYKFEP